MSIRTATSRTALHVRSCTCNQEVVQIIWGKSPVDYRVPPLLNFPAFTIFSTNYPAFKMFMLLVSVAIFLGLLIAFKKTRVGLCRRL